MQSIENTFKETDLLRGTWYGARDQKGKLMVSKKTPFLQTLQKMIIYVTTQQKNPEAQLHAKINRARNVAYVKFWWQNLYLS